MALKDGTDWWYMPVTQAHGTLRQEHCEFEANVGYMVSSRSTWTLGCGNETQTRGTVLPSLLCDEGLAWTGSLQGPPSGTVNC